MPQSHPTPLLRLIALSLIGLCLCGSSWAQWKWRDAQGKLQFSDLPPPPSVPEKDILQKPPGLKPTIVIRTVGETGKADAPAPAHPPASAAPDSKKEARRKEEQALAERQKLDEKRLNEARADNCRRARQQLKLLEDGVRITMPNDRGENIILDDKAREQELRHTRAVVASDCL